MWGGACMWTRGYPDRALATLRAAEAVVEEIQQPPTRGMAFNWRAIVHLERGEIARAEECNDEVFALFEVRGESFGLGRAAAQRARLLAETGDPEAAAGQLICDGRVRKSQHPVGRMPAKHLARRVLCESWDALETPS